jgi:hypothetical protein
MLLQHFWPSAKLLLLLLLPPLLLLLLLLLLALLLLAPLTRQTCHHPLRVPWRPCVTASPLRHCCGSWPQWDGTCQGTFGTTCNSASQKVYSTSDS